MGMVDEMAEEFNIEAELGVGSDLAVDLSLLGDEDEEISEELFMDDEDEDEDEIIGVDELIGGKMNKW